MQTQQMNMWAARAVLGSLIMMMAPGCHLIRGGNEVVVDQGVISRPPDAPPSPPPEVEVKKPADITELESSGQLVKFYQLRTMIIADETMVDQTGQTFPINELEAELRRALVQRDFRIFSDRVGPGSDVARLSRQHKPQLLVYVTAQSKFNNTTGRFSRYRANGEIRAVRGRDGTELALVRKEAMGPRHQEDDQAGRQAIRQITPDLVNELLSRLVDKETQLRWAGLVVDGITSIHQANSIVRQLEANPYIEYVELLEWDRESRVASFEIIYGLRHDADLANSLRSLKGINIRPAEYRPDEMKAFRDLLKLY